MSVYTYCNERKRHWAHLYKKNRFSIGSLFGQQYQKMLLTCFYLLWRDASLERPYLPKPTEQNYIFNIKKISFLRYN